MRTSAAVLVLLLAGCMGSTQTTLPPLPQDFTVTQPATLTAAEQASYTLAIQSGTHLNATLVWTSGENPLGLEVTAGGSGNQQGATQGTVSHLERDLYFGTWLLKVTGKPVKADTWHLEVHFTRA